MFCCQMTSKPENGIATISIVIYSGEILQNRLWKGFLKSSKRGGGIKAIGDILKIYRQDSYRNEFQLLKIMIVPSQFTFESVLHVVLK